MRLATPMINAMDDRSPAHDRDAFHCPHCDVYASQNWKTVILGSPNAGGQVWPDYQAAVCGSCHEMSLWRHETMIFPRSRQGREPHPDMPEDVQAIYDEAREVASISRKSAAGLARLALQMLVDELEQGKGSIDQKIGRLVAKGLPATVQQSMDVLRVVGNESVHPGQIDLDADGTLLPSLFGLLNIVVEQMIAGPRHIAALYAGLPEEKRQAIERRDARGHDGPTD